MSVPPPQCCPDLEHSQKDALMSANGDAAAVEVCGTERSPFSGTLFPKLVILAGFTGMGDTRGWDCRTTVVVSWTFRHNNNCRPWQML